MKLEFLVFLKLVLLEVLANSFLHLLHLYMDCNDHTACLIPDYDKTKCILQFHYNPLQSAIPLLVLLSY